MTCKQRMTCREHYERGLSRNYNAYRKQPPSVAKTASNKVWQQRTG